jgi:glutamine amidotransferase
MIAIVNYGMGNLVSLRNAFNYIGVDCEIIQSPKELLKFEKIVLPGVGSFRKASEKLIETGFMQAIRNEAQKGKPVLGICLGMQLLADFGFEGGGAEGLKLVPGQIVSFDPKTSELVPYVGFQSVNLSIKNSKLFHGIPDKATFYFTHSFYFNPESPDSISSVSQNGEFFCASVERNRVYGVQFHPELSQKFGLNLLKNFSQLC